MTISIANIQRWEALFLQRRPRGLKRGIKREKRMANKSDRKADSKAHFKSFDDSENSS